MAKMTLADLVQRQEFCEYFRQDMITKSTLIQSGIAAPDPTIAAKIAAGSGLEGKTLDMASLDSLDAAGDAEVPVEATGATEDKIGTKNDTAVVQFLRKKFGVTDVAAVMGKVDPMAHIVSQLTPYWLKQDQKRLLAIVKGIFASNDRKARVANATASDAEDDTYGYKNGGGGDMTFDITGESGSAAQLAKDTILTGAQLLGDRSEELTAVAMNSATAVRLAAMDTNAGLYRASEAPGKLATYNGRAIIIDDLIPYDAATKVATIYLFGRGVVSYNELPTKVPFEMDRDKDKAIDYIHSWRRFIMHVRGMKCAFSPDGLGPTVDELETAGNWTRIYDKKRIPLVRIKAKLG
ncbi:MAG: major capsid protein [Kiritimatiellia bacterium]